MRGFDVRLYNRTADRIAPIRERGGIELLGVAGSGFVEIPLVTTDLEPAVSGADVIVLCLPVSALSTYAPALAPLVSADQVVFLNPGHMGGSLYFRQATGRRDIHVCETTTLTYACRMRGAATVAIFNVASELLFAALPATETDELYERVASLYPSIVKGENVLQLGLQDLNAVEHPAQALMNAGWLEHTKGDYLFYTEGTTPSVARAIEAVDAERMALAAAIGVPTRSFVDYFFAAGYTSERAAATGRVYEALQDSEPNSTIKGPPSLDHRYIHEDVGWGLVPWIHLARLFNVPVPTMEALAHLASVANEIDYLTEGLTLERMGLAGLDRDAMASYVNGTE